MDIIYKKLYEIRKEPNMYLGRKSVKLLWMYISGYTTKEIEINPKYHSSFWTFGDFVALHYDTNTIFNWSSIIMANTKDDENAFDKFYKLLDEFLGKSDDN